MGKYRIKRIHFPVSGYRWTLFDTDGSVVTYRDTWAECLFDLSSML